jgi:Ca2+-binding EF-hand superfamily protein
MKKFAFAAAALTALAAVPALAQQGGEEGARVAQPQTRAEAATQAEARFARADANRDGFLTQDEMQARAEARDGEHRGRGGFGGRRFEAMDADHDGRVALTEASRAALERFDRIDADHDGSISQGERQAAREAWRARMQDREGE